VNKKFLGVAIMAALTIITIIILSQVIELEQKEPTVTSITENKKLGLVINTPTQTTTLQKLNDSYELAASSQIGRSNVYMFWNVVEPERGNYNWEPTDVLMSFNKKNDLKVTIYFSLINGKTLGPFPSWIGHPSLNSISEENLINVLDAVLSRYDIVDTLIIAGGTDEKFRYLERDIPIYDELFSSVYQNIKEKHPEVKIGNSFSLNGVLNKNLEHIVEELDDGDFVAFTYMPVDSLNDIVKTPQEAMIDLEKIFEIVPNKKVALFEISWSTSDFVGGNEEDQKQFVEDIFSFYKEHEEKIEFITWYRLYDRPDGTCYVDPETVEGAVSIGGGSGLGTSEFVIERLGNYVCNAGLYYVDNTPKPAWDEFKNEISSVNP